MFHGNAFQYMRAACVFICMRAACMFTCMRAACVFICMRAACMFTCMRAACMFICMRAACMFTCMCAACMFTCMHVYMHAYLHACVAPLFAYLVLLTNTTSQKITSSLPSDSSNMFLPKHTVGFIPSDVGSSFELDALV